MKAAKGICIFLMGLTACLPASADLVTFTLNPVGGEISGAPGDTVGWGFTIDNETGYFLLIDNSVFNSVTAIGSYVDYTGFAPEIGPAPYSTSYSAVFDAGLSSGIAAFQIDPSAVVGASWGGQIVITYDLFDKDPSVDPNAVDISAGNTISQSAQIDIVAPSAVTPEPSLRWVAAVLGAGLLSAARLRRVRCDKF